MTQRRLNRAIWIGMLALTVAAHAAPPKQSFEELREKMVQEDIIGQGIKNQRVVESLRATPRHEFVALNVRPQAYFDMALPIGEHQTISAPFIVAYMTEQLDPQPGDKVLEIGTGSGFQAAVLSPLVKDVYTIEILRDLGLKGEATLKRLNYKNVHVKIGDGYQGWPENAPFDKIIVTCSPEKVPQALKDQLKEGGRMVVPVGERYSQVLYLFKKEKGELVSEALRPTLFVPMTGKAEEQRLIKPDPANPKIYNGSFEELAEQTGIPTAWHYQRQMEIIKENAPDGKQYVLFKNETAGRSARLVQGVAIDGRSVKEVELQARIRFKDVRQGQHTDELPAVILQFYDQNRATIGHGQIGPFRGSNNDWQRYAERVKVPGNAREATAHIGLFGATGEAAFDAIELKVIK